MAYDISDLAQLIDIREGALNRNAQRKKDYNESMNKGLEHFNSSIDNVTDTESLNYAKAQLTNIMNSVDTPEGQLMAQQSALKLRQIEDDILYYNQQFVGDDGSGNPDGGEYMNVLDDMKRFSDNDFKDITIKDVANLIFQVNNILSATYEDPFAEKPKMNKFVNKTHLPLINNARNYQSQLEALEVALYENGTVDDHELQYILTNDSKGLETARDERAKTSNARLTSIMKSINIIEKYKKQVLTQMAESKKSGGIDVFVKEEDKEEIMKNSALLMYLNNPDLYLDIEHAYNDAEMKYFDATPSGLLKMWDTESKLYMQLFQNEHDVWFKWQGRDWAQGMGEGYLDRQKDAKVKKQLK